MTCEYEGSDTSVMLL